MALKVDRAEFARFLGSGIVATAANLGAVMATRVFVSYELALLAGIAAGSATSFVLSKLWAFRSRNWAGVGGQMMRFTLVYGFGLLLYWASAVVTKWLLTRIGVSMPAAEIVGVLGGAALMMLTSYFGHKHFTYRAAPGARTSA